MPSEPPESDPRVDAPEETSAPAEATVVAPEVRPFLPRDPKALTLHQVIGGLVTAGVTVGLMIVSGLLVVLRGDSPIVPFLLLAFGGLWIVVAFFSLVFPRWAHRRYHYRADEQGLEILRGVWWRRRIRVPRSRLQHTDVAQGPLERQLGLGSLIVHTAGTHNASITLSGVTLEAARAAREILTVDEDGAADGV